MKWQYWLLLFIITAVMKLSVFMQKLTPAAAFAGGVIGISVYIGAGFTGIAMMAAFFVLGTTATAWQIKNKKERNIAEENSGRRRASQVVANAGMAAVLGLLVYFFPRHTVLLQVMLASSFSSATADTMSSELGNVYGKRFYNVLSFKKDKRGLDGVVSLEGTTAGICGSILIAFIYVIGFGWHVYVFVVIILAGTIGNFTDSLLGAAFERRGILKNDVVNFLNTAIAALAALLFF